MGSLDRKFEANLPVDSETSILCRFCCGSTHFQSFSLSNPLSATSGAKFVRFRRSHAGRHVLQDNPVLRIVPLLEQYGRNRKSGNDLSVGVRICHLIIPVPIKSWEQAALTPPPGTKGSTWHTPSTDWVRWRCCRRFKPEAMAS